MTLEVFIDGEGAAELAQDLHNWLQAEQLPDFNVEFQTKQAPPGAMGFELLAALKVIFGARAATELTKSISTWIKSRRPRTKLKLKRGKTELTLDLEAQPLDDALIAKILLLLESPA